MDSLKPALKWQQLQLEAANLLFEKTRLQQEKSSFLTGIETVQQDLEVGRMRRKRDYSLIRKVRPRNSNQKGTK